MIRRIVAAVIAWLELFEFGAVLAGLRGLSWGGSGVLGRLPLGMLASLRNVKGPASGALFASTLVPALLLQVGLASVRRWRLNPLLRLRPGSYADRSIERVDVPGPSGAVPGLHIVPHAGATGAVCVVHGSGCDKTFYAWRLVDAFVAQGVAVILVDLDGHGESPRSQDFPAILGSVVGPVDWLHERYQQVGVLGTSLGGAVATRAVADGAAVDALALMATPPQLRLTAAHTKRIVRLEVWRIVRPKLLHLLRDGSLYHIVRAWRTSGIRARIGTWDLFDELDLLGSLQCIKRRAQGARPPLLLVYGGSDAIVATEQAQRVGATTKGWAEWHFFPRASHISLPVEVDAITLVTKWFAGQFASVEKSISQKR